MTLIDAAGGPAMGTSHANGAQLSYCYTDALGNPWTMASVPRLIFGNGGVKIRLGMHPRYLYWLASFARNCTYGRFKANTLKVLDLAQQSRRAMDALCERHTLEFCHHVAGKIHLVYSPRERERALKVQAIKVAAGCEQQLVERADFCALDPGLKGLDRSAIAAISTPSEFVGDPLLFCRGLLRVLVDDYGVKTRFDSPVRRIRETDHGAAVSLASGEDLRFDMTVLAAGPGSNRLLAPLQSRELIQPMKGYSFEMPTTPGSPQVSVTDGKRRIVFTHLGNRMRVAGMAELGNASRDIDPQRIEWLVNAARDCLPSAGDYSKATSFWTGLRPTTPDSQPVIRRAGKSIAINTGHGALGWTLAMGSAERLAELVED